MKLYFKYLYSIFLAISICIILRFFLIDLYGDTNLDNEWSILFNNLYNHGVFSYRSFDNKLIPSVYMPPLYIYYIYFIKLIIPEHYNIVKSVLISQIFLSGIAAFYFFKINLIFFSKKISLISTYIFILFPLNILSCLQISSITLQIFLNILFLYITLKIINNCKNKSTLLIFSVISGLTILLRGEFILILSFSILYLMLLKKINFKQISIIIIFTSIILSPYLIRNYLVFEKITITKSFGYNLWKGNNIDSKVEGSESLKAFQAGEIYKKIKKIPKNNLYDFNYDEIFLENSIKFIQNNPTLFIERYVKKFLSYSFLNLNSEYPEYYHPLNIIPLIIISIIFILSLIFCYQKKSETYNYLILNLLLTIAIFSVFFILPRYKLMIIPIQLILINFFICFVLKSYKKK